jgi:hypothetical protein
LATTNPNSGWPDATNTGVPAGVTLTPSGDLVVTQAGAVISGLNITGSVIIKAPNVTIENCKITSGAWFVVDIKQGVTGTVIQNCEINGVGSTSGSVGINGQGTFIGNNIYNVENGINLTGSSVIKDNYIHDLNASGSPHYDGIQIDGGVSNVTISDNTVIAPAGGVSAIMIDNYWGPISNISVSNNLLAGGGFTVYCADAFSGGSVTGVSFTNNHMKSGQYGYTSFYTTNPTYTGNVYDGATLLATLNTTANTGSGTTSPPTTVGAPVIASWSSDSGVAGDHITNDNTLTLTGTAVANSTVKVFDGATEIATVSANSSGAWSYTIAALADGTHNLTATATNASGTSAASAALAVTIDTVAPNAPVETGDSIVDGTQVQLTGTAEANSALKVYDGTVLVGTGTTDSTGHWTVKTSPLSTGAHDLTATATDAAGNTSAVSLPLDPVISEAAPTSAVDFTDVSLSSRNIVTIKGTADANSQIKLYDGNASLGTVTTAADGTWTFKTSSAISNAVHTFTAKEIDSTGQVVASSGSAILGSTSNNTLSSTSGDDYFVGKGGADTFVFAPNFGNDVIKDFGTSGRSHDTIQISKSVFDSFAAVLSHAQQVGQDVVISTDANDSLTLKNVKLSSLNSQDFHFS